MAQEELFDLIVIGGGPAGLAAATRARAKGVSVVLIRPEDPAAPAPLHDALAARILAVSAGLARGVRDGERLGIAADPPAIDFSAIAVRMRAAADAVAADAATARLEAGGIAIIPGRARFSGPRSVAVGDRTLKARRVLIATGAQRTIPPIPGLDGVDALSSDTILALDRCPEHLVIVGSDPSALAIGQSFVRLGAMVSVVDPHAPLGGHDPELARIVLDTLAAEGMAIHPHTGVVRVAPSPGGITVAVKRGTKDSVITASHLLVSDGWRPDIAGLALDAAKIGHGAGALVLGAHGATSNRRVFAAGDAAGHHGVHAARHSAETAVEAMFGRWKPKPAGPVPRIVHTDPPLVQIGLTEEEARARFSDRFVITRASLSHTDAALAEGGTQGHIKLFTLPEGKIVGAGLAGPLATEIAPVLTLAIGLGLTAHDLERLAIPYPAHSEIVSLIARQYAGAHPSKPAAGWRMGIRRLFG